MCRWTFLVYTLIILVEQGCGLKPPSHVPQDVTIPEALAAVEKFSAIVKDFSGRANVKASIDGDSQSAIVSIKFLHPDLFRLYI